MAMKWCVNCDALFVPHKRESNAQWANRRFCCRRCAQRYTALRRDSSLSTGVCSDCGKWREANPGYWRQPHIRERNRQWLRDHPEAARKHLRATIRRRRARAAGRSVEQVRDTEAYIEILGTDICAYCGDPADTIDHIDALTSGGDHVWENMTAACRSCNSRKHTASLLTFLLRSYWPQTGQGVEPDCA